MIAVGRLGMFRRVRSARGLPLLSVRPGVVGAVVVVGISLGEAAIMVPWPVGFMTLRTLIGIWARTTCCMATEFMTSEP